MLQGTFSYTRMERVLYGRPAADCLAEASFNGEREKLVAEAFGQPRKAAGDILDRFIGGLGLPRSLGEVGVGHDRFPLIAENAMHDHWVHANPRPITGPADVEAILRLAV